MVRSVSGVTDAEALDGVQRVAVALREGTGIGPVTNSWQRAGHVLATGTTPQEAARTAERAAAAVRFGLAAPAGEPR
ncbi:hypothetical protein [Streptomyces sp. CYG20]|uniref:hypothetical protein n=1 Tax=Streptomyces sp. CYG20 TaxID=2838873 RepID=UPI0027E3D1D0|nr:hypothetical protein [Streptomyces sp. CYG20]